MDNRFIPRKSKVKVMIFKNFGLTDIVIAMIGVGLALLLMFSNLIPSPANFYAAGILAVLWVTLFFEISEGIRLYYGLVLLFIFWALPKRYKKNFKKKTQDINRIMPFVGLSTDKFIDFGGYYGMVVEIFPMSFGLLSEERQDAVISTLSGALTRLNKNQKISIIRTRQPMVLDELVRYEDDKYNTLIDMSDKGLYDASELDSRSPVFEERLKLIRYLNNDAKIIKDHYFLIVYDTDREALESTVNGLVAQLENSANPIFSNIVLNEKLLVFIKSTFTEEFDQRELEMLNEKDRMKWALPDDIRFKVKTTTIDGKEYRSFTVTDYPISVYNAWLYPLFTLDESRVVVNIEPMENYRAERMIDKSLMEVEQRLNKQMKESQRIETQTHYETLRNLLESLKSNNEVLFNCNIHIMADEKAKKEVRAVLRQYGFKFSENFGRQIDGYVSSALGTTERMKAYTRGIQSSTVAAGFPFISNMLQDDKGFYIGYNKYPVFINFFERNSERVNSNMMVIGKSGAGKSFTIKTLLTNFAADNTRVFILDPENEYEILCHNLRGKIIDVGSSVNGIFNPFHIYPTLEAENGEQDDSFSGHLQFLEQFYRLILPGISSDAFERLNSISVELYRKKNIGPETRIEELRPEDFPIFDDLLELIDEKLAKEKDEYHLRNYMIMRTYIEKFATGGRNSNLWNGYTSIKTNENFICFNFRTLVSNRNDIIANAQMLLVFKYLDSEIIKNRDFNLKYYDVDALEIEKRRVIVAVDEAHVFINKKFPIALDFMQQMAKRIRKYSGMQIIITQNIKDFVGSEEIATQSTAIINACQYSMILSLSPNDINDLISLYRNAGGINNEERDSIVAAKRGQVFFITSPTNRTVVQIEAMSTVKTLFEDMDYLNNL